MLTQQLIVLKNELIKYGALTVGMIEKSIRGLLKRDRQILMSVIEGDEPVSNQFELELDEICTTTIAQFEPKAKDLRTILMIMKMNNDLERMGDMAVNICESALFVIERKDISPLIDVHNMAAAVGQMLKEGIDAFVREDTVLAKQVCDHDNIVDELRDKIQAELIALMRTDSSVIERAFHLVRITRDLERVADLTTNIGEDVVFMVEGKVIKHHRDEA